MSYVYVLTNDLFPGLCKIGACSDVHGLLDQLTDSIPGRSYAAWYTLADDSYEVATRVRTILAKFIVPDSRGWYSCPASVAIEQFQLCMAQVDPPTVLGDLLIEDKRQVRSVADLGAFCREWRQKVVFTQKELADHADVHVDFIADLENGLPSCSLGWCLRVANLLGIDLFAAKR